MRTHRSWLGLLLGVVLAGTGCEAPLKPKSQAPVEPQTRSASPLPSPTPRPTPTSTPTESSPPTSGPGASVTVPKALKNPELQGPVLGADASWPQCPKGMGIPEKRSEGAPMPLPGARFVILGLTNGPGFFANPCLASQVEWVRSRRLLAAGYSVISWPDRDTVSRLGGEGPYNGSTRLGALSNVGYQQAKFNVATLTRSGLRTPVIWLDVEPVPRFEWSADTTANAAVVRGAARGYTDAGFAIGAYSTQALWQQVVGDLALGIPEWRAAGQTSRAEALRRCGPERMFQGGAAVLSQWVEAGRDQNVTCPGTSARMGRWFHQY